MRRGTRHLVGFFRRQGADAHAAEDLTQEVFLKLFRSAASYRPEERFAPYVFRIARNVWIDAGRRRAARPVPEAFPSGGPADGGPADTGPGAEARASLREEGERLQVALGELSESHRLVFELGLVQGLPYAEVAAALGIPLGTVKSRMFHAVRRLRARLEEEGR